MLCSAGVSYFHVYPNGDVYRCLADYNARRAPMFNLKRDGWKGAVDPTVCDHERCYNACDLDWTTKWQVDGQGRWRRPSKANARTSRKRSRCSCARSAWSRRSAGWPTSSGRRRWRAITPARTAAARPARSRSRRLSLVVSRADRRRMDRHLERHPGALRVRHPQHHRRRAAAQRGDPPRARHGDAEVRLLHHLQHQPQHHGVHPRRSARGARRVWWKASARCPSASAGSTAACTPPPRASTGSSSRARSSCCGMRASRSRSTTSAIRSSSIWRPSTRRGANRTRSSSPCRPGRAWTTKATSRATPCPSGPSSRRSRRRTARRRTSWCSWIAATT